jgi:hypothetical protein
MNFQISEIDRDEELRLLNVLGFPDFDEPLSRQQIRFSEPIIF